MSVKTAAKAARLDAKGWNPEVFSLALGAKVAVKRRALGGHAPCG